MIVTRYEMLGTHGINDVKFEFFMEEYERFMMLHSTTPTRVEINPVFYSDITASEDARKYALESENKSFYLRQIYGLDIVLSSDIEYGTHRYVFEKIASK